MIVIEAFERWQQPRAPPSTRKDRSVIRHARTITAAGAATLRGRAALVPSSADRADPRAQPATDPINGRKARHGGPSASHSTVGPLSRSPSRKSKSP